VHIRPCSVSVAMIAFMQASDKGDFCDFELTSNCARLKTRDLRRVLTASSWPTAPAGHETDADCLLRLRLLSLEIRRHGERIGVGAIR
jgi:hypothetical protein